ncbi:MAG TPA: hypothetical protein VHP32_08505 [Ignavibacteria bacterium]|nr:hypothetical protein [Ignavibacteria bacterium]
MDKHTVISNNSDNYVELINYDTDPNMWIVRVSKKILFFKKQKYAKWFNSEKTARAYAESI